MFHTIDSGDGETRDYECDRPMPYVVMDCDGLDLIDECDRLCNLLAEFGITTAPLGNPEGNPSIQGSYDPVDLTATIELLDLCDANLPEGLGC
jgi:hypothetical protein